MLETKEKFYTSRNDRVFKEIFMKEENKDILKNEYKNFSLKKITFDNAFDGFDERQTFNILHITPLYLNLKTPLFHFENLHNHHQNRVYFILHIDLLICF